MGKNARPLHKMPSFLTAITNDMLSHMFLRLCKWHRGVRLYWNQLHPCNRFRDVHGRLKTSKMTKIQYFGPILPEGSKRYRFSKSRPWICFLSPKQRFCQKNLRKQRIFIFSLSFIKRSRLLDFILSPLSLSLSVYLCFFLELSIFLPLSPSTSLKRVRMVLVYVVNNRKLSVSWNTSILTGEIVDWLIQYAAKARK